MMRSFDFNIVPGIYISANIIFSPNPHLRKMDILHDFLYARYVFSIREEDNRSIDSELAGEEVVID